MIHKESLDIEKLLDMSYHNQEVAISYLLKNHLNCSLIRDLLYQLYPDIDANFGSREVSIWIQANYFYVKENRLYVYSKSGSMMIDLSNNQIVN